ncbi:nucleotidyltransferase domain protein [Heliomicrobium modesticaldum Ice1]|uniref:Nucleotidyltransferase domain protein n=1 Tax=Heliobacterium modesticaldum (strain ATCC 51547 / Ice1) TaxID=498761 RepID=B0TDJ1_HELMI|nr:nucleotidyltransferase domain-containing protein [Heliomicrobium modesticaldum]ABZ85516.1 nucleotidyltransferase domain protein [Heliomicrobium modesticaldum Ice1]
MMILDSQKTLESLALSGNQRKALQEFKERLEKTIPLRYLVLFGSVARQTAGEDSDVDILVVADKELSDSECRLISDIVFETNLKYDTTLSFVPVEINQWERRSPFIANLYKEVRRDGVIIE